MLLAAWWLLKGQSALWRRWIWDEAGASIRATADTLSGALRPVASGYRVDGGGVRVEWRAGMRGARTRIRVWPGDGTVSSTRRDGLLDDDRVLAIIEDLRRTDG